MFGAARQRDAAYFSQRAAQERAAAMRAANVQAREAHLELAKRYDELITLMALSERGPEIAA